jgi:hypothetical protein
MSTVENSGIISGDQVGEVFEPPSPILRPGKCSDFHEHSPEYLATWRVMQQI